MKEMKIQTKDLERLCAPIQNLGRTWFERLKLKYFYEPVFDLLNGDISVDVDMVIHYRPTYFMQNLSSLLESRERSFNKGLIKELPQTTVLQVPESCLAVYTDGRDLFAGDLSQTRDVMARLKKDPESLYSMLGKKTNELLLVMDLVDKPRYADNFDHLF